MVSVAHIVHRHHGVGKNQLCTNKVLPSRNYLTICQAGSRQIRTLPVNG